MKPGIKKLIAAIVLATIAAVALWYHLMSGTGKNTGAYVTIPAAPGANAQPAALAPDTASSPATATEDSQALIDASEVQKAPPFAPDIRQAKDLKIWLRYEADIPQNSTNWQYINHYTPPKSSEKYLAVDRNKATDDANRMYGSGVYHVFVDEGSHTYEGIPIYIKNKSAKYAITHVGLRISDPGLIYNLRIEAGIDFMAYTDSTDDEQSSSTKSNIVYASLFGPSEAQACGSGRAVTMLGISELKHLSTEGDVFWYELQKPIKLYDIGSDNCGDGNTAKDSDEENGEQDGCMTAPDLGLGNLRMHITYVPNTKRGLLVIQLSNLIFKDADGAFYQPEMTGNVTHSYKAYVR